MSAGTPPPFEPAANGIPFERPEVGFFEGLMATMQQLVTRPRSALASVPRNQEIMRPLLYLLLLTLFSGVINLGWQHTFFSWEEFYPELFAEDNLGPVTGGSLGPLVLVSMALAQLVAALVLTALIHFLLMLFNAARQPAAVTFKVYGYAAGTASLANMIPVVGGILGPVWLAILLILGMREAHETTTEKAAMAVLAPTVALCLCCTMVTAWMLFGIANLSP